MVGAVDKKHGFYGKIMKINIMLLNNISCDVALVKASSFCDKAHSLSLPQLYIIAKI